MLDILNDYLNGAVTSELKIAIEDAHAVFERIELPNYENGFEELLMTDDTVSLGDTPIHITNLTIAFLRQILFQHGITTVEGTDIVTLTKLARAMLDIQDYDNPTEITRTASTYGSPEEILAEIIALVTEHNADEILIHLETVSQMTITRIIEVMGQHSEDEESDEDITLRRQRVELFVRLQNYLMKPIIHTSLMLSEGLDVGLPFLIYADRIGRDFESMPVETVSHELVAMALISADGMTNPAAIIKQNIERFISSLDKVTKVDIAVSDLLIGFKP